MLRFSGTYRGGVGGVGWGGDDIPCTCARVRCYATDGVGGTLFPFESAQEAGQKQHFSWKTQCFQVEAF